MIESWQGYNNSGELVYRFESRESAKQYGLSINCKSKKFCNTVDIKGDDIRFYFEEVTITENYYLIRQISKDYNLTISANNLQYLRSTNISNTSVIYNFIKSMKNTKKETVVPTFLKGVKEKALTDAKDGGNYDVAGNSEHYQKQFMEFIRSTERLYGTVIAYLICVGNIDKYAGRAGEKAGVPAEKDLIKKSWYTKASVHFKKKIEAERNGTVAVERNAFVHMPEEVVDVITADKAFRDIFHIPYVTLSTAIEK